MGNECKNKHRIAEQAMIANPLMTRIRERFARKHEKRDVGMEYLNRLVEIGRPLSCIVTVARNNSPKPYNRLNIVENKKTISYSNENNTVGYKILTHTLCDGDGNERFGVACCNDGTVQIYDMREHKNDCDAVPYGESKLCKTIVDPMIAFEINGELNIVLNVPTKQAISDGAKARKPVPSSDNTLIVASGAPIAIRVEKDGKIKATLKTLKKASMPRYAVGLVDDSSNGTPSLLVANVLLQIREATEEDLEEMRPGFGDFVSSLFGTSDENVADSIFPLGVSIAKLNEQSDYVPIPMDGSTEFGITGISLEPMNGTQANTIRIVSDEPSNKQDAPCNDNKAGNKAGRIAEIEKTAVIAAIDEGESR